MRPPALPPEVVLPSVGRRVWTCRAGFEAHLFEELAWSGARPRLLGPALVEADAASGLWPAFGRAGFRTLWSGTGPLDAAKLAATFAAAAGRARVHVQAWAVDDPKSAPRTGAAEAAGAAVTAALGDAAVAEPLGLLAQVVAAGSAAWIAGAELASDAVSLAPGGRQRMRRDAATASRAALKLEEALRVLGHEPGRGETCADLGAAPGGWTQRLVARGARVWAVDPARLSPELAAHPKVRHVQQSAFAFEPPEPLDWLFCDMAWRPLEVAQLLARWARRGWALHLVANIKLPMKDKNPVLYRVRQTLEDGGWAFLRVRQLYHDRDEVTVTGRRRG